MSERPPCSFPFWAESAAAPALTAQAQPVLPAGAPVRAPRQRQNLPPSGCSQLRLSRLAHSAFCAPQDDNFAWPRAPIKKAGPNNHWGENARRFRPIFFRGVSKLHARTFLRRPSLAVGTV